MELKTSARARAARLTRRLHELSHSREASHRTATHPGFSGTLIAWQADKEHKSFPPSLRSFRIHDSR